MRIFQTFLVVLVIFCFHPEANYGQAFKALPENPALHQKIQLHGSGYISPSAETDVGLCPSIQLSLALQPMDRLLVILSYTRNPEFDNASAQSLPTASIIFPEKNTNAYLLHLSVPIMLVDREVALRTTRVSAGPFYETYYVSPRSSRLDPFSLSAGEIGYEGLSFQVGAMAAWEYYPKIYRYGLSAGVFYYRTNILDDSKESFRNMLGDPYLPAAFRGLGAKATARINDFSASFIVKQNINLIQGSKNTVSVNGTGGIRKLNDIEGMHVDFQIGWSGKLLSL